MDPMMQGQLKEWFILLAAWGMLGWGIYLLTVMVRRKQKNDLQRALLEKFASAHDFAEFMQSPAGQKYVMSLADNFSNPYISVYNSVKAGFVFLFLGAG